MEETINNRSVTPKEETIEVEVEKLVYGGDGLARAGGRVLLSSYVLPGEKVTVRPVSKIQAKLVGVREASGHRTTPGCPYFGRCGGCHYQHATYEYQVEQKVSILREVLRRVGKFDAPEEIHVITGEPWNYRNRSQFHYEKGQFGYLEAGSHRLCPVELCPISSPGVNRVLAILRDMAKDRRFPDFVREVEVFTNETEVQLNVLDSTKPIARHFFDWCAQRITGMVAGPIDYRAGGDTFRVSGKSFFQVNRFLVEALTQEALFQAEGAAAVDLYSGAGLFSIPLARKVQKVMAVESSARPSPTWPIMRVGGGYGAGRKALDGPFLRWPRERAGFYSGRSASLRAGEARGGAAGPAEAAPPHDCGLRSVHAGAGSGSAAGSRVQHLTIDYG
jgi:SAM-dependent methyltransferases related to tRNA (uracil-5-)-methyltransferase